MFWAVMLVFGGVAISDSLFGSLLLRRGHAILKTKLSPVAEGVVWEVRKKEGEEMIYGEAGLIGNVAREIFFTKETLK